MFSHESGTTFLAWWGAVVSTWLAITKFWELWRDRFHIEIGHNFTGSQEIGNEVLIRNLSGRTFILTHWELFFCDGYWPLRRITSPIAESEYDARDNKIEPHSTYTLRFVQQNYFDWGPKALKGRKIFIRLYAAGRKPIVRRVYAP